MIPYISIAAEEPPKPPSAGQITITIESSIIGSAVLGMAVAGGTIKWFVEKAIKQMMDNDNSANKRLDHIENTRLIKLEHQFQDQEAELGKRLLEIQLEHQRSYVLREDWIAYASTNDAKLDATHRRLDELKGLIFKLLVKAGIEQ